MSRLHLPDAELTWRFSRSSGAGGQHVNTTDTRVELLWDLRATTALSAAQRDRAADVLRSRLVDGTITVVSSQYRSQHRNREAARARLEDLVARAIVPPKVRRATRPTRASSRRRLEAKKRRSDLKQGRAGGWTDG
ncbi:peptidyl-tRNA hydrolase domain protein [Aeromicrobium marinum DSM 15272]|uniref:Peptidyl-tRNA hydrolase domain protein n=1 Tax=Aeromicrobium marinum DSM 15272 TaxID=585531 RepID=E2SCK7_9ACTN|nr:alternative ribosome rescue aminoacyl-tRNA hydrolase ArfB [Aeromicrobium marinum]EFQ82960.1 peptidyl-tRNA hydrolase domain protein [Aeromicrobium marinum DSM 15272]